jgi:hypothetical protein
MTLIWPVADLTADDQAAAFKCPTIRFLPSEFFPFTRSLRLHPSRQLAKSRLHAIFQPVVLF